MSSSEKTAFYRQIIMDHYQNPRHKGLTGDPAYRTVHLKNPSCGDDISIQLKTAPGEKLEDVRHMGAGCAICCASGSMMCELLRDKSGDEALEAITEFRKMVSAEPFNREILEECVSLEGVSQVPPRINCAMLAWNAAEEGIRQLTGNAVKTDEGDSSAGSEV